MSEGELTEVHEFLPPLGGEAPPLQCNRLTVGGYCGRPGAWHILWTVDLENGIACQEHYDEARREWVFYAAHRYETTCSLPGAVYVFAENRCVMPEDDREPVLATAIGRPLEQENA